MKIIKPQKLGLLHKMYEYRGKNTWSVTLIGMFPFEAGQGLYSEAELWKFAAAELGGDQAVDAAMPKARGELLVTGSFYAPDGVAVPAGRVRLALGNFQKELYVFGDRFWQQQSGLAWTISDPRPMTSMAITWQNAYGGSGYQKNPLGKGLGPMFSQDVRQPYPLPNIENSRRLIGSPNDQPEPCSFGPLDMTWPQRALYSGTYDEQWFQERFPAMADDLDWRFYNTAPEDQWINGFFRGDEPFEILSMHPDKKVLRGRLPGLRPRCFISRAPDGTINLEEVALRLDTVWLFPHAEKGILVYHGNIELAEDNDSEIKQLIIAYERASDEPRRPDHYEKTILKRLDKEKGFLCSLDETDLIPVGEKSGFAEIMESEEDERRRPVGEKAAGQNQKRSGNGPWDDRRTGT